MAAYFYTTTLVIHHIFGPVTVGVDHLFIPSLLQRSRQRVASGASLALEPFGKEGRGSSWYTFECQHSISSANRNGLSPFHCQWCWGMFLLSPKYGLANRVCKLNLILNNKVAFCLDEMGVLWSKIVMQLIKFSHLSLSVQTVLSSLMPLRDCNTKKICHLTYQPQYSSHAFFRSDNKSVMQLWSIFKFHR